MHAKDYLHQTFNFNNNQPKL